MLKRKITDKLIEWKAEPNKCCLLVKGARQVGKTFIINEFAKANYRNYIYINFEINKEYMRIFDGDLDFKTLKMKLETAFPNVKLEAHQTIIFLDEIQSCPNARVALKSFALDGSFDVVASGSLLGINYKQISSYPVGYEKVIELAPLDFEEFLWGVGFSADNIAFTRNCFLQKQPLDEFVLNRFAEQFKLYTLVGGMPRVVEEFIQTSSLTSVLEFQRSILQEYFSDIAKYTPIAEKPKVADCLLSIPIQLGKKNKKFTYADIAQQNKTVHSSSAVGAKKYLGSINWLKEAGIVHYCYNLTEPALPLTSNIKLDAFKIYMRDSGLLIAALEAGTQKAILDNELYINKGGIVENVCAAELAKAFESLMYFEKKSKLEVDFILNLDGQATAIEVKSGDNKQSKSLKSILQNYHTVTRYIKLEKNTNLYVDRYGIEHYPLFMVMFIA
ncbi:MAG: AAA family ATPase [Deltaproteobacteria bacterium]|jgi:predicted AAA+ superfamily ATPase|nr:AAA family ATPase [Deltaproteobacteria bacterium]